MTPLDDPHLHRALRSLPPPTTPATLAPRVMAAVRQRQAGSAPGTPAQSPLVLAAAAAGLAAAIALQVWWIAPLRLGPDLWGAAPTVPQALSTASTLLEACRLALRALYGAVFPWIGLAAVVSAVACVPSLLLLDRLTETRA